MELAIGKLALESSRCEDLKLHFCFSLEFGRFSFFSFADGDARSVAGIACSGHCGNRSGYTEKTCCCWCASRLSGVAWSLLMQDHVSLDPLRMPYRTRFASVRLRCFFHQPCPNTGTHATALPPLSRTYVHNDDWTTKKTATIKTLTTAIIKTTANSDSSKGIICF